MVIDFRRRTLPHTPVHFQDLDIETVDVFKYLGVGMNKNWSNADALYKKRQSHLSLLRRFFGVCTPLSIILWYSQPSTLLSSASELAALGSSQEEAE